MNLNSKMKIYHKERAATDGKQRPDFQNASAKTGRLWTLTFRATPSRRTKITRRFEVLATSPLCSHFRV